MFDLLVLLLLAVVLVWQYADLLFMLLVRAKAFLSTAWLVLQVAEGAAATLVRLGFVRSPTAALVFGWLAVGVIAYLALRYVRHGVSRPMSDLQAVALDVVHVALVLAVLLVLAALACCLAFLPVSTPALAWLLTAAVVAACVDLCYPRLLPAAGKWLV
jgi:hypothetical protein